MRNSFNFLTFFLVCYPILTASTPFCNVVDYGAIGNGQADDTQAFAKAWEATCASLSPTTMKVPSGKTFLIQPLRFIGPCKSNSTTVKIDGNLVAPNNPYSWRCDGNVCHQLLYFHQVDGLTLKGQGIIDGQGQQWWTNTNLYRPTIMEISNSNNVSIDGGLTFKDSPSKHIVLNGIQSLSISGLTIEAPGDSPNTDGMLLQYCTNVHITSSRIGTGDDCIAIINGTLNARIDNIVCGPGHGISIGSLGNHGAEAIVEDITVSNVLFRNTSDVRTPSTSNGARIKTWQGGRGYVRNIHYEKLWFHDTVYPIIIDQFYGGNQYITSNNAVEISNVSFNVIVGISSGADAVVLNCSKAVPCRDVVVQNLHVVTDGAKPAAYSCENVFGRALGHLVPKLSCLL
ncbi:probable polygalacturonase At3g15720 [Salvia splendens]|uniref:probable polygalacturonase At3g15720 n=1 Tax=Salvia splendens TaxID=180675 RepID=UPI001C26C28F|nr:probable polygalacturonase At3g15720 [Salvia splendens]